MHHAVGFSSLLIFRFLLNPFTPQNVKQGLDKLSLLALYTSIPVNFAFDLGKFEVMDDQFPYSQNKQTIYFVLIL